MSRRPFRIILVLLGVLITAGLGYRALQDEQARDQERRARAAIDRSAEEALSALSDLRAALHAYSAPGQELSYWSTRSAVLLDTVRERLLTLDGAAAASGGSLAESLDGVDQLTAAETRARTYAGRGESLLSGDVIFTEMRDLLATNEEQVRAAREAFRQRSDRLLAEQRREQAGLAGGALALWVVLALVLLPSPSQAPTGAAREWREELADALKKPVVAPEESAELRQGPVTGASSPEAVAAQPAEPAITVAALKGVGEICSDLSTLSDVGALTGALARACEVLGASGLIVWVASNDGSTLSPVATHGFEPKLVARIGTIARDSSNLTAAAFRENSARVSPATATSVSALAVSLCGPSGPVGVLSAELRAGRTADEGCVALAVIFAAQLATLAVPVSAPVASTAASAADENARAAAR